MPLFDTVDGEVTCWWRWPLGDLLHVSHIWLFNFQPYLLMFSILDALPCAQNPICSGKVQQCILQCHDDNLVTFRLQLCPTVSSCAKQQCCLRQGVFLAASSKLGQPGWLIGSVLLPGANSALPSNDVSTGACRARSEIKR